jgi:hypothetical protein
MNNVFKIIAVLLLVFWVLSVLVFAVGQLAHLLLLVAAVSFLLSRLKKRRSRNEVIRKP